MLCRDARQVVDAVQLAFDVKIKEAAVFLRDSRSEVIYSTHDKDKWWHTTHTLTGWITRGSMTKEEAGVVIERERAIYG